MEAPARVPGSVRRTSHVDMIWLPAEGFDHEPENVKMVLRAGARDLVTGLDNVPVTAGEARVRARLDATDRLLEIEVTPDDRRVEALLGRTVRGGWRAAAVEALPDVHDLPLGLLLDDLPVGVLVGGFSMMKMGDLGNGMSKGSARLGEPRMPEELVRRQIGICSGWREDGRMIVNLLAGNGMPVPETPDAPLLGTDDPHAFEAMAPLTEYAVRRRRRIDVHPNPVERADLPFVVDAWFRDTHVHGGVEGVIHEYRIQASFGRDDLCIDGIWADARVLPHDECPFAAAHVGDLIGVHGGELRERVGETLQSLRSCTHLNDLLRSMACVPHLADLRP